MLNLHVLARTQLTRCGHAIACLCLLTSGEPSFLARLVKSGMCFCNCSVPGAGLPHVRVTHRVLAFVWRILQLRLHTGWVCTRAWHPGNLSCARHVRSCARVFACRVAFGELERHCFVRSGVLVFAFVFAG